MAQTGKCTFIFYFYIKVKLIKILFKIHNVYLIFYYNLFQIWTIVYFVSKLKILNRNFLKQHEAKLKNSKLNIQIDKSFLDIIISILVHCC